MIFYIRQYDLLPELSATILDNGSAVDLSGCTVDLILMDQGTRTTLSATIVNAILGTVKYTWQAGDTDNAIEYEAYWLITYPDTRTASFPNFEEFLVSIKPAASTSSTTTGWVTLQEACSYLDASFGNDSFLNLDQQLQRRYLTSAYRMLVNDTNYTWPSITQAMKDAQTELAAYLFSNPSYMQRINLQNMGVDSMRIGDFSESYASGVNLPGPVAKYPQIVMNLIEPYFNAPPAIGVWERHC